MAGAYIYYCEVTKTRQDIDAGVYRVVAEGGFDRAWFPKLNRLVTASERVWKQGPKGGVKIVKQPYWSSNYYGGLYQTHNPQAMKEFAWIKLRAKAV